MLVAPSSGLACSLSLISHSDLTDHIKAQLVVGNDDLACTSTLSLLTFVDSFSPPFLRQVAARLPSAGSSPRSAASTVKRCPAELWSVTMVFVSCVSNAIITLNSYGVKWASVCSWSSSVCSVASALSLIFFSMCLGLRDGDTLKQAGRAGIGNRRVRIRSTCSRASEGDPLAFVFEALICCRRPSTGDTNKNRRPVCFQRCRHSLFFFPTVNLLSFCFLRL